MEKIIIAEILKPHGIKGELKAKPVTHDDNGLLSLKTLFLEGEKLPRAVKGVRLNGGYAYFYLEGVISMNDAELLRGKRLLVPKEEIKIPEGHFLITDVIESVVFSDDGTKLGILSEILQNGSADVYVVTLADGKTLMFPFIEGVAMEMDVKSKRIVVSQKMIDSIGIIE